MLLQRNNQNIVVLNLSENVTITGATVYFLFKFENDDIEDPYYFTATDISSNLYRHNKFNITLTSSTANNLNLTGGTISLPTGFYKFFVYQQLSQTNLSITGITGNVIKKGICIVSGTSLNDVTLEFND